MTAMTAWSLQQMPLGARWWLLRHMEAEVKGHLHRFITLKSIQRCGSFCSIILHWTAQDHQFFFATLDPLLLDDDSAMVAWLCPVSKELPWKRIGRQRSSTQRLQVCGPGLVRRTVGGRTKIFFAYNRFDLDGDQWVEQYARVEGVPGAKKARRPK